MMSLALNVDNWWESCDDELWRRMQGDQTLSPKTTNGITAVETKL